VTCWLGESKGEGIEDGRWKRGVGKSVVSGDEKIDKMRWIRSEYVYPIVGVGASVTCDVMSDAISRT